jgi:hypothetical protein
MVSDGYFVSISVARALHSNRGHGNQSHTWVRSWYLPMTESFTNDYDMFQQVADAVAEDTSIVAEATTEPTTASTAEATTVVTTEATAEPTAETANESVAETTTEATNASVAETATEATIESIRLAGRRARGRNHKARRARRPPT